MAAPPKPWERPGVNQQSSSGLDSNFMSSSSSPGLGSAMSSGLPTIGGGDAPPPPVPSRPTQTGGYSGYSPGGYSGMYSGGMYSSPYSMYGGYGGYGMYGGYSGYGAYGMNRYGYGQQTNEYNSFARMAEESSRPAFQSIESIVGAFSSVSMMLDSTFQAVYNSFRAVIGVADNFSRMRIQFAQIFSAFALFRTLRYLYRKLLVLLRLRPQGFAEEAWVEAGDTVAQNAAASGAPSGGKSTWPVLMFFAIILGGPWLIWKFLRSAFANPTEPGWANGSEDHFVAKALYSFQGQSEDELSFQAGSNIQVAPKELQPRVKGWLLASVDGKKVGLVPANYVKVLGKRRGTKVSSYPVPNELNTFDSTNSQEPVTQTGSENSAVPISNDTSLGQNQDTSLVQSASALNLENQARTGFTGEASLGSTGVSFREERSPLDSVPELPPLDTNVKDNTDQS